MPFPAASDEETTTAVEKFALDRHVEIHLLPRPLLSRVLSRVLGF